MNGKKNVYEYEMKGKWGKKNKQTCSWRNLFYMPLPVVFKRNKVKNLMKKLTQLPIYRTYTQNTKQYTNETIKNGRKANNKSKTKQKAEN